MSLSWKIAILAAILWTIGLVWCLKILKYWGRDTNEDIRAMQEAMTFIWSEDQTLDVVKRFPNSPGPLLVYAGQAAKRQDFVEAARRFQLAINLDRKDIKGYRGAIKALRDAGQLDAAEALIRKALRRFPADRDMAGQLAWNARRREDWPEAVRRWAEYRKRFPTDKTGYVQGVEAFRKAGRAADADALAAEVAARFAAPEAKTTANG